MILFSFCVILCVILCVICGVGGKKLLRIREKVFFLFFGSVGTRNYHTSMLTSSLTPAHFFTQIGCLKEHRRRWRKSARMGNGNGFLQSVHRWGAGGKCSSIRTSRLCWSQQRTFLWTSLIGYGSHLPHTLLCSHRERKIQVVGNLSGWLLSRRTSSPFIFGHSNRIHKVLSSSYPSTYTQTFVYIYFFLNVRSWFVGSYSNFIHFILYVQQNILCWLHTPRSHCNKWICLRNIMQSSIKKSLGLKQTFC